MAYDVKGNPMRMTIAIALMGVLAALAADDPKKLEAAKAVTIPAPVMDHLTDLVRQQAGAKAAADAAVAIANGISKQISDTVAPYCVMAGVKELQDCQIDKDQVSSRTAAAPAPVVPAVKPLAPENKGDSAVTPKKK